MATACKRGGANQVAEVEHSSFVFRLSLRAPPCTPRANRKRLPGAAAPVITIASRRGASPTGAPSRRGCISDTGARKRAEAPGSPANLSGEGRYLETKIGTADGLQDADGVVLHSFRQAQEAAREWWKAAQRADLGVVPDDGPYTVAKALEAYFTERAK